MITIENKQTNKKKTNKKQKKDLPMRNEGVRRTKKSIKQYPDLGRIWNQRKKKTN